MISAQRVVPTTVIRANDSFKRFKPEPSYEVRKPDVTGTEIDQLRARREMLRGMTPEKALEVIEFHRDLNFFQALALAKQGGKLIVPNDVHDRILMETADQEYPKQNYPIRTGTLVIYEKPDKPFGEEIFFQGITFNIPQQFRGKTNCALVIQHPDFELVNLGNNKYEIRVPDEANIRLIEDFPKKNEWYMPDAETSIPHGKAVKESSDSRCLWRSTTGSYLGPLGRGGRSNIDYRGRDVGAYDYWFVGLGVALL